MQAQQHVLVVGAGPLGAAAARHLAALGAAVTVVGPDEPAGWQGHRGLWSGHYDAGRCAAVDVPLVASLLGVRAMRRFASLQAETGVPFATRHPVLNVVPEDLPRGAGQVGDWLDLDALLANAADLGVRAEALDQRALASRFPQLRLPAGYRGVLQEDAYLVDPRALVRAELAAAASLGAQRVWEEVVALEEGASGVSVRTRSGETLRGDLVLLATGAFTNACGLLPRPLDVTVYGCTLVLLEVDAPDGLDFPAVLPFLTDPDLQYAGVVMPPRRYPDGRWYVKATGADLISHPLGSYEEVEQWVATGGSRRAAEHACEVLAHILPDVPLGRVTTRPCLPSVNASGQPYVDLVGERVALVVEGERGVMLADELGRLAARLLLAGRWDDPVPGDLFQVRYAGTPG